MPAFNHQPTEFIGQEQPTFARQALAERKRRYDALAKVQSDGTTPLAKAPKNEKRQHIRGGLYFFLCSTLLPTIYCTLLHYSQCRKHKISEFCGIGWNLNDGVQILVDSGDPELSAEVMNFVRKMLVVDLTVIAVVNAGLKRPPPKFNNGKLPSVKLWLNAFAIANLASQLLFFFLLRSGPGSGPGSSSPGSSSPGSSSPGSSSPGSSSINSLLRECVTPFATVKLLIVVVLAFQLFAWLNAPQPEKEKEK